MKENQFFLGMLINQKQLNRLVVHEGEICYTVNEQEVRYIDLPLGDFKNLCYTVQNLPKI